MKKTLTIIILSISLSGFSQTEKGDWAVGIHPEYRYQDKSYTLYDQYGNVFAVQGAIIKNYRGVISANYYLSDKFSIGGNLGISYSTTNPLVSSQYFYSFTNYEVGPILRYNFLKTRLTPYLQVDVNYNYRKLFYDIPTIAVQLRPSFYSSEFSGGVGLGLSYFIRDRFALQANTFFRKFNNQIAYNEKDANFLSFGFGCIFIINNPRSEIESPR